MGGKRIEKIFRRVQQVSVAARPASQQVSDLWSHHAGIEAEAYLVGVGVAESKWRFVHSWAWDVSANYVIATKQVSELRDVVSSRQDSP